MFGGITMLKTGYVNAFLLAIVVAVGLAVGRKVSSVIRV